MEKERNLEKELLEQIAINLYKKEHTEYAAWQLPNFTELVKLGKKLNIDISVEKFLGQKKHEGNWIKQGGFKVNVKENINTALPQKFSFYNSLIYYGFKKELVSDWISVRKNKKATNTQTAFNSFIREIEKRTCNLNEILEFIVSKNWSGFKWEWYDKENNFKSNENGKSTITQTEQFKQIAQAVRSDGIRR